MGKIGRISVCMVGLFILSACDGKPTLDESHAKQALQSYYDAHPFCTSIAVEFPLESSSALYRKAEMDPLVKAGLVALTGTRYAATAAGEAVLHRGADKFLGGTDICFAKRSVQKITVIIAPAEAAGVMTAKVSYDYVLKDVAPWANEPAMASAFPQIAAALGKPEAQATEVLFQASDGWRHERVAR
jgi:hypothetical protein